MIRLIDPCIERTNDYYDLCIAYSKCDQIDYRKVDSVNKAKELIEFDLSLNSKAIPDDNIKTLVKWAIDGNNFIIGSCRIRLELNDKFMQRGGHIGYDVRPEYRKMGYGTKILALALRTIRQNGIKNVLLTCEDSNIGSYKIIEKNGGRLEKVIYDEKENKMLRKYWVYY